MNTERLHLLADVVEKHAKQFDMHHWVSMCGSPACIAGFAEALAADRNPAAENEAISDLNCNPPNETATFFTEVAAEWLEIDDEMLADELFRPASVDDWNQITAEVAALCLRLLAETGDVDWEAAGCDRNFGYVTEEDNADYADYTVSFG